MDSYCNVCLPVDLQGLTELCHPYKNNYQRGTVNDAKIIRWARGDPEGTSWPVTRFWCRDQGVIMTRVTSSGPQEGLRQFWPKERAVESVDVPSSVHSDGYLRPYMRAVEVQRLKISGHTRSFILISMSAALQWYALELEGTMAQSGSTIFIEECWRDGFLDILVFGSQHCDNTGNVRKTHSDLEENEDLNVITYGCSAHLSNLLTKDLQVPNLKEHVVEIVKYFCNNLFAHAKYKQEGGRQLVLTQDVPWNTMADCLFEDENLDEDSMEKLDIRYHQELGEAHGTTDPQYCGRHLTADEKSQALSVANNRYIHIKSLLPLLSSSIKASTGGAGNTLSVEEDGGKAVAGPRHTAATDKRVKNWTGPPANRTYTHGEKLAGEKMALGLRETLEDALALSGVQAPLLTDLPCNIHIHTPHPSSHACQLTLTSLTTEQNHPTPTQQSILLLRDASRAAVDEYGSSHGSIMRAPETYSPTARQLRLSTCCAHSLCGRDIAAICMGHPAHGSDEAGNNTSPDPIRKREQCSRLPIQLSARQRISVCLNNTHCKRKVNEPLAPLDCVQAPEVELTPAERFLTQSFLPIIDQFKFSLWQRLDIFKLVDNHFGFINKLDKPTNEIIAAARNLVETYNNNLTYQLGCELIQFKALYHKGAAMAERSASSPPKVNRVKFPAGSLDSRKWESIRTMSLVSGFSRGSLVSHAPSFQRRSIFTSIALIASQNLPNTNIVGVPHSGMWKQDSNTYPPRCNHTPQTMTYLSRVSKAKLRTTWPSLLGVNHPQCPPIQTVRAQALPDPHYAGVSVRDRQKKNT
ncbi:hypothetical protein PR048_018151 [Dryococelus australis]|uniref:Uncharacterized protein n=1 Tax=Dryococelus australis TaxID=614101 RepID=A0ABQ9HBM9_9NEOP|nr:hypothetical protein PR048_018151 [Dryococelus australis]